MNVDNVIVTTLVDETAEADDVDDHDWGDDHDGNVIIMMVMKRMKKVNGMMKMKTLRMTMRTIIWHSKAVMMTTTICPTMIDLIFSLYIWIFTHVYVVFRNCGLR